MKDNDQIRALFANRIAYITGSTRLASLVHAKTILMKKYTWLLSIVGWTIILYFILS